NVNAPVLGVGLTSDNVMDAPKGPAGDPIWHTAFWYRGSGVPGDPGTATIAGHVDDLLGKPEIFAHLQDLHPGDLIIIRATRTNTDIRFVVNQIEVYSTQQASDPAVLAQIYGSGPLAGTGPQPALDGLSHLTLITCAGNFVNGQYDHHTVVYATRSE
ncbi:MAG TPA: class F sortase, partial [Anaerolineae bacterium]